MKYDCPHCKKGIVESNSVDKNAKLNDLVIKSRLVFLNGDGNVLCKCGNCKKLIALPLSFSEKEKILQQRPLIDI